MHMHLTSVSIKIVSLVGQYDYQHLKYTVYCTKYKEQPVVLCEVYIINNVDSASETAKLGNYSFGNMKFGIW